MITARKKILVKRPDMPAKHKVECEITDKEANVREVHLALFKEP